MIGRVERRRFLAVASGTIALLAGCTGGDDDGAAPKTETTSTGDGEPTIGEGETATGSDTTPTADSDETSTADSSTGGDTDTRSTETADERTTQTGNVATATDGGWAAGSDDLDLREANVVDVTVDRDGRSFGFDVTLYHDDDGEDEYANWWQVETLDGDRLGRRELLHAHSTAPFTRSATIEVPEGVTCVVVRGHDQIHDYGGQAALVNLDSGDTAFVRQGTDKRSFDASACP